MDRPKITPKDFFLWLGAMVALYWSVVAFILLIFNYIDYAFPNALSYAPDPYEGGMPYEMASILVLVPVYIALSLFIRRAIAQDPTRKDVWVRRWAVILTLFVAGVTVAVDVITLLTSFFRGEELTTAFLLKVLVVLAVALVGFAYFAADLKGYWDRYRQRERFACVALGVLALVSVVAGFFIVGTPSDARLLRLDNQKISDLQSIQWQVVNYWQAKQTLPAALSDLSDPISGFIAPTDPQSGDAYGYKTTGELSFDLCAVFSKSGDAAGVSRAPAPVSYPAGSGADLSASSWSHGAGETCFERTIDPEKYPPLKK